MDVDQNSIVIELVKDRYRFDGVEFFSPNVLLLKYKGAPFVLTYNLVNDVQCVVTTEMSTGGVFCCVHLYPFIVMLNTVKNHYLLQVYHYENDHFASKRKLIKEEEGTPLGVFIEEHHFHVLFKDRLESYSMSILFELVRVVEFDESIKFTPSLKVSSFHNDKLFVASRQQFVVIDCSNGVTLVKQTSSSPYLVHIFDGSYAIISTLDHLKIWNVETDEFMETDSISTVSSALFLTEYKKLIVGQSTGEIAIYNIEESIEPSNILNQANISSTIIREEARGSVKKILRIGNFIGCVMGEEVSIWDDSQTNSCVPLDILMIDGKPIELCVYLDSVQFLMINENSIDIIRWFPDLKNMYNRKFGMNISDPSRKATLGKKKHKKKMTQSNSTKALRKKMNYTRYRKSEQPKLFTSETEKKKIRKKKKTKKHKQAAKLYKANPEMIYDIMLYQHNSAISECFEDYLRSILSAEYLHLLRAINHLKAPDTSNTREKIIKIAKLYLGYKGAIPVVSIDLTEANDIFHRIKTGYDKLDIFDMAYAEADLQLRDHFSNFLQTLAS
eukprot:TRINITY_DN6528_c0_g1_i2.p1 TRINITY_DN6528_c0_g1~~TRINITY_DN6528_c0_g1_i2.p1  ORF type:complete len:557 (-),score=116.34 TRINITY_DN6528_c0_g1_i2:90-1760(-)